MDWMRVPAELVENPIPRGWFAIDHDELGILWTSGSRSWIQNLTKGAPGAAAATGESWDRAGLEEKNPRSVLM